MSHALYIYSGIGRLKHNISKRIIQTGRHFTISKTLTLCEAYMVVIGSSNGVQDWCSTDSFISISRQCIIWMKMALYGKTFRMFPHLSEESIGLRWIIIKKIFFICGRSELTVEHVFSSSVSPWRLCNLILTSSTRIVAIARTTLTRNATSAINTEFFLSKIECKQTRFINHKQSKSGLMQYVWPARRSGFASGHRVPLVVRRAKKTVPDSADEWLTFSPLPLESCSGTHNVYIQNWLDMEIIMGLRVGHFILIRMIQ